MTVDKLHKSHELLGGRTSGVLLVLMIAVPLLFTLIIYPNLLVARFNYGLGDIAEKDVKAHRDFLVEDQAATEIKRQQAVQDVLTVYDLDTELGGRLARTVDEAFADMRAMRRTAAEGRSIGPSMSSGTGPAIPVDQKLDTALQSEELRKAFEDKLGIRVGKGAFVALEAEGYSKRFAEAIGEILQKIIDPGVVSTKEALLKDFEKGVVLRDVHSREEKVVKDFKQFSSLEQARSLVRSASQPVLKDIDYALANLAVDFCQRLIQPNITLNRSETELRKARAASEIKPVLYKIKQGEMLLREGERVTDVHLLKLKALESEARPEQFLLGVLGATALMLGLIVMTYVLFLKRVSGDWDNPTRNILLMACVFLVFQLSAQLLASFVEVAIRNSPRAIAESAAVFIVPLAAAPMIICVFLGLATALPFAVVSAVAAAVVFKNSLALCVFFLISGSMGAYWIRNSRERKVFVTAGAKTGLLAVPLSAAVSAYVGHFTWTDLVWTSSFAFLGGMGSGVVAAGVVPLVEIAFGYTTDITLLELANLDRPILRQLMIEAPGTYHHSVIVGSMVEAAAVEIEANPLLAKVTGYYHDIGKIRKPQYFIENQRNGKNKHDKLAPSMSSLILVSHIKEGVEIGREHKLGKVIIDGIRSHHGTSLIRYFYEKAKLLKGEDAVKEEDFRYPGPKPRTREAALVMLADVVEAASRTLENPTPARLKGLVKSLMDRILSDGQLDECEITLKELHKIASSFNAILNGIHHHRIEYFDQRPTSDESGRGKAKNGHSDRQPSKPVSDIAAEDSPTDPDHLRRAKAS
jgi:putative nucleotidyltransferase with HDIG domain